MPVMDSEVGIIRCAKCHAGPALHKVRDEKCCRDCFVDWVGIKVSKRLGMFRIGHGNVKKRVILAISFGYCSLALLAILDGYLERQRLKTNRVGFELTVLHISGADACASPSSATVKLGMLQEMFPKHEYSSVSLEDGVKSQSSEDAELGDLPISIQSLQSLSASSHEDMMLIIRNRLIAKEARKLQCSHILYGDSTSKLSERILAETAKGRGFALPQVIGDATPPGELAIIYPLRDIYRSEMKEYAKAILPEMWALVATSNGAAEAEPRTISARNMTIDKLMAQYVTEMEDNLPSIVSNVLRTSDKLAEPLRTRVCPLCRMAMDEGASGLRGWGGDQAIELSDAARAQDDNSYDDRLCYGCSRSLRGG